MKLIALDQNAVSNLAMPPITVWSEILDLLRAGVTNGSLVCPTPTETISESVHLENKHRRAIEEVCDELSTGYFFRFPWETIAIEALAKVRPGLDTFPFWIPSVRREQSDKNTEEAARAIWKEKSYFESAVNAVTAQEVTLKGPDAKKLVSAKSLAHSSAIGWLQLMRSYLNKLRNGQMIGDEQFIIQQVCATLIRLQATDKEIAGLLRGIQSGEWLRIPMLVCWFALDGLFFYDQLHRGRRFEYNDEWDKYRAGDAYQCAHCFITDRGMASALRQVGLQDAENFQVFSAAETKNIVAYLKQVV